MENPSTSKCKRGRRGGTRLKELALAHGGGHRKKVNFDELGNPTGPGSKQFKSFVGTMTRSKISILIEKWDHVDDIEKDQLWQAILLTYDIPQTQVVKTKILQYARGRWKDFKSKLTSIYVFGKMRDQNPCEKYEYLDQETWEKFVSSRHDPAFMKKREEHQEIQKNNVYPHTLSRGGYELLEEQIMEEKLKARRDAAGNDESVVISPPSPPSRHEKWKRARLNKEGQFLTEEARVVAEKIDTLEQEVTQGSFTPVGRKDILATALGKEEHPGRVRGVGGGVGIRQYFGPCSSRSSGSVSMHQVEKMMEDVREQTRVAVVADMEQRMEARMEAMQEKMMSMFRSSMAMQSRTEQPPIDIPSPMPPSTKGSCVPQPMEELEIPNTGAACEIYLEDPYTHIVAYGKVFNLGGTIHHQEIQKDQVRVVVEDVVDHDALVPFPTEEVTTVQEAPKNFILWPKRLVRLVMDQELHKTKDSMDSNPQPHAVQPYVAPELDAFTRLTVAARKINTIQLRMGLEIVGKEYDFCIKKRDVIEFIAFEQLGISMMQLFIMYLHDLCTSSGRNDRYGFLCPMYTQSTGNKANERMSYIADRLRDENKQCWMVPYYEGTYWKLGVICPQKTTILWFSSMEQQVSLDVKSIFETSLKSYQMMGGKHSHKQKKCKWEYPQCHRHQGDNESSYYVMRYMYDIIKTNIIESFHQHYDDIESYSDLDMEHIRNIWAEYFLQKVALG